MFHQNKSTFFFFCEQKNERSAAKSGEIEEIKPQRIRFVGSKNVLVRNYIEITTVNLRIHSNYYIDYQ